MDNEMLLAIGQLLDEKLDKKLDEKLDEKLAPIHSKLDEHSRILNEHSVILSEHSVILNEHSAILNEHSEKLDEHGMILKDHGDQLNTHSSMLKEQYGILKALEHAAEVNTAERDKMQHDIAHIKGDVESIRKDMARVEEATAYNWADIAKLKAAQ